MCCLSEKQISYTFERTLTAFGYILAFSGSLSLINGSDPNASHFHFVHKHKIKQQGFVTVRCGALLTGAPFHRRMALPRNFRIDLISLSVLKEKWIYCFPLHRKKTHFQSVLHFSFRSERSRQGSPHVRMETVEQRIEEKTQLTKSAFRCMAFETLTYIFT